MEVITAIIPVVVLIGIGIFCKQSGLVSARGMADVKTIIANIMLPVTLFHALGNANYDKDTIRIVILFLLVEIAAMLVGYPLKRLIKNENSKFLPILLTTAENGMLGYPLYIILCGQENLGYMATIDIAVTAFGFSVWSSVISQIDSGDKISGKSIFLSAIKNPCLWGVVLGVAAGVSGAMNWLMTSPINALYNSTESLIVAPISTMILIALGYDLVFDKERIMDVIPAVAIRYIVQIVLLLIVWQLIGKSVAYEMQTAILLFFFLPVAFSSQVYVSQENSRSFIASFVSLYSVISIFAFAVLLVVR
ncbi:MAG: AEC family transporter [Eubacteriales bacterium]|nr:AEC family transporter [Eubacteriales bacterium]